MALQKSPSTRIQPPPPPVPPPFSTTVHRRNPRSHPAPPPRRNRPPMLSSHAAAAMTQQLPRQWALSCFLFCTILESTRLVSPSSLVYYNSAIMGRRLCFWQTQEKNTTPTCTTTSTPPADATISYTNALLVATDYALGGFVAGGAAVASQLCQRHGGGGGLRPAAGMALGAALGATAGIVQAAAIVLEDYNASAKS